MDHAVALVQAYLQLNGYFTSAEYPIIAGTARNGFRTLTDIDILAFRFPSGQLAAPGHKGPSGLDVSGLDPGLGVPGASIDMVIGEVKEGRVGINTGIRDPEILKTVVSRFGEVGDAATIVQHLLDHGTAQIPPTFSVRLIAFGSFPPGSAVPPCRIISLGHVLQFLQSYVRKHWQMLRHLQFKDPAFGFLMTLEKARRGGAGRRGREGVEIVSSEKSSMPNGRREGESGLDPRRRR
ncbi:MAG TPA: hypothetical protein VGQ76_26200 [Thermoanaerobaculia bacterium]|jgi:hypothetical protein|nr:hypothetical protein [Thermoanaerobaculia bacterium]